jgi:acetoin utilization deacetylase AcuC-like enzyme
MWHGSGFAGPPGSGALTVEPGDVGEETPHPRRRLRNLLEVSGILAELREVRPVTATMEQLCRVHTPGYVERIRAESLGGGGMAGEVTPFGPGGFEIAALAAGACIAAVDAVLAGAVDNAYALVRPAGHHALADAGRGFCIFANAAIAVRHAQQKHGVGRIAVIDWDVHHGNGTESIFWEDPNVLTVSLHQADWYPRGEGSADALGSGEGLGRNINVPLPPGSGIGAYRAAFERIVVPALYAHRPDLVVVCCGLDANAMDPSGRMLLTSEDFRALTRITREAAQELCGGRLVLCHEGGYAPVYVPFCGLAVIEELAGCVSAVQDPLLSRYTGVGFEGLQRQQEDVIEDVLRRVAGTGALTL